MLKGMENIADLTKPPFDKPVNFTKMFSQKMKAEIVAAINEIRDNAVIMAQSGHGAGCRNALFPMTA